MGNYLMSMHDYFNYATHNEIFRAHNEIFRAHNEIFRAQNLNIDNDTIHITLRNNYTPHEYRHAMNNQNYAMDPESTITFNPQNPHHIRDINSTIGQLYDVFF